MNAKGPALPDRPCALYGALLPLHFFPVGFGAGFTVAGFISAGLGVAVLAPWVFEAGFAMWTFFPCFFLSFFFTDACWVEVCWWCSPTLAVAAWALIRPVHRAAAIISFFI